MLTFGLLFVLTCMGAVQTQGGGSASFPIIGEPIFLLSTSDAARLGFQVILSRAPSTDTAWEKSKFGLLAKWWMAVKSKYPSPVGAKWHYRFVLEEQEFPDSVAARVRLASLFSKPPRIRPEDNKAFPLRRGFVRGNRVVLVKIDVAAYSAKLDPFTLALETLAAAPETANRRRLLDSLGRELKKGN